ncbi:MAG: T9SS type A sorting domain-containing protein [Bacteroidales bacterium]|nr:T9SS type A sorting domain-containing protein [Bacteroidales bacterium]MBN2698207.1 T9SS type A sorting domain-containing protein [Bacteroidales bacterium]
MNRLVVFLLIFSVSCHWHTVHAQEVITPLRDNPAAKYHYQKITKTKSAQDIILELPVTDDFSNSLIEPDPELWSDRYAFINHNLSLNPVTIGVATLDALNFDGSLYAHAVTDPNTFTADYLTSHPVNLDYPPSDSIYLSFYYQPGGKGELPEPKDSLSLQFFNVPSGQWNTVWQIPGEPAHDFRQVMIPVTDNAYLKNGFRFRFKNLASLARSNDFPDFRGNVDHWNIDYVKLDMGRSIKDTIQRDVAFTESVPSILKNLESLPWKHFQAAYNTARKPVLTVRYLNNDTITRNVTRSLLITDLTNNISYEPGQPTAQDLPSREDTVVNFSYTYPFDFEKNDEGLFRLTSSLRTDIFDNKDNDTVSRIQVFKDYYAYDDGTAEFGYGLRGQGTMQGKVALKYNIFQPDLIGGIDASFNQIYDSLNLGYYFRFMIWDDNNGTPGSLIFEDDQVRTPVYAGSINGFKRFEFSEPVPVDGTIYVGWSQTSEYLLNIGLDINSKPSYPALFYNIGDGWKASIAPGIIMLRPYIYSVNTGEPAVPRSKSFRVYPNPAAEWIVLDLPEICTVDHPYIEIFDTGGRVVLCKTLKEKTIDVSALDTGFYLIRLQHGTQSFHSKLLINK